LTGKYYGVIRTFPILGICLKEGFFLAFHPLWDVQEENPNFQVEHLY
jgi:hypothetical protein